MKMNVTGLAKISFWLYFCLSQASNAQDCPELNAAQKEILAKQHLGQFHPEGEFIVHRAYALNFNTQMLVPNWVAWRIEPAFRDTPKRTGKWSAFRPDPEVPEEYRVVAGDYSNGGYHRGHMAPFFISGGDRDGDGQDAEFEDEPDLPIEDIDDACTVFEINYMSNMSPQLPRVNSQGGAWYDLETQTRGEVDQGASYQVIAGNIFLSETPKRIGKNEKKIAVPDALYKILDDGSQRKAYLFFQESMFGYTFGCLPEADLAQCVVTLDELRTLPGVKF
ncbi:MAG: DNA/RNA non-specific endonuclease [Alphaproteobacteria bacterium]|nr:MAG: DNA/RNA non-specific endonuclease [Alphaproteobacteria bacterium]